MLRKRTRSHQKDQHMNDATSESFFDSEKFNQMHKSNTFFNPKNSEFDSVQSPKSPLDFRVFTSFGNPFRCHKKWDCSKVGLSIIDTLDDETKHFGQHLSIKNPNFVTRVNSSPKSLPKSVAIFPNTRPKPVNNNPQKGESNVVFEIGEASFEPDLYEPFRARSLDSAKWGPHLTNFVNRKSRLGSGNIVPESKMNQTPLEFGGKPSFSGSVPSSEIELSEDYTCVITHGPNAKVTHIFGDCILECHNDEVTNVLKKSDEDGIIISEASGPADVFGPYPPMDFLKFCHSCKKELDGEDIYMYRGEKAFCSYICRSGEIEVDEEMEKKPDNDPCETFDEEISTSESLFIDT